MFHFIYSFAFILIFIILKHKKIKSRVLFALFQNPRLNFINHFSIILLFFKLNSFCVHLIKFFCLFLSFLNYELYCPRFYFQPHFFPLSAILTIQCPLDCFFWFKSDFTGLKRVQNITFFKVFYYLCAEISQKNRIFKIWESW